MHIKIRLLSLAVLEQFKKEWNSKSMTLKMKVKKWTSWLQFDDLKPLVNLETLAKNYAYKCKTVGLYCYEEIKQSVNFLYFDLEYVD